MNVTLRQLRAFVALARAPSFTEAAARLHVTQSALSGLIKELELTLGLQVFHRTTRRIQLSEVGAAFQPLAERILQDLDQALGAMEDLRALKDGIVRVAVPQLMACTLLPAAVRAFRERRPGVEVRIADCLVEDVLARVNSGEVDFGIGPERDAPPDLVGQELFSSAFLAVFPKGHPLGRGPRVKWAELARYPLVSLQGDYTRLLSSELLASPAKMVLQPRVEVAFMTTALSMVSEGQGVTTCLPYARSLLDLHRLETRPLVAPKITRVFSCWSRRDRKLSGAAQEFAEFLGAFVRREQAAA
jgi:DNA-binding transcriptional LysR family regulator